MLAMPRTQAILIFFDIGDLQFLSSCSRVFRICVKLLLLGRTRLWSCHSCLPGNAALAAEGRFSQSSHRLFPSAGTRILFASSQTVNHELQTDVCLEVSLSLTRVPHVPVLRVGGDFAPDTLTFSLVSNCELSTVNCKLSIRMTSHPNRSDSRAAYFLVRVLRRISAFSPNLHRISSFASLCCFPFSGPSVTLRVLYPFAQNRLPHPFFKSLSQMAGSLLRFV